MAAEVEADADAEAGEDLVVAVLRVLPVEVDSVEDALLWELELEDFSTVNCWDWARIPCWTEFSRLIW